MTALPLCPISDLPRLLCGCPQHAAWAFEWDELTDAERSYLEGQVALVEAAKVRHHTIRPVDYQPAKGMDAAWRVNIPTVVVCDHGHSDDTFLCPDCAGKLEQQVGDVPALVADLEVALTKQVTFVEQGTPLEADPDEASLDWNEGAAKCLKSLRRVFGGDPVAGSRACLRDWSGTLRRADLPTWAGAVTSAVRQAHHVIDRPAEIVHYGECPQCGEDIDQERVHRDDLAGRIQCDSCGYTATLEDHQRACLDAGGNRLLTVTELVSTLTLGGEPVARHQITNLIQRHGLPREKHQRPWWKGGRLESREVDVFRLGDVRDMLVKLEIRRARKGA